MPSTVNTGCVFSWFIGLSKHRRRREGGFFSDEVGNSLAGDDRIFPSGSRQASLGARRSTIAYEGLATAARCLSPRE